MEYDVLPSIGDEFECIYQPNTNSPKAISGWLPGDKLQVIAHVRMQGATHAVFWNERDMTSSTFRKDCYRPMRTPEQIAADERDKDIEELRVLLSNVACDDYHAAVAMIDAGYRKTASK